jgi:hypothetical protein
MKCGTYAVGHYHYFVFGELVGFQDSLPGEFARSEHAGRRSHRTAYGQSQLQGSKFGEVFGMLQETDIVDADDNRGGTSDGRGVLDVQNIRAVFGDAPRQIEAEPHVGIDCYLLFAKAIGDLIKGIASRNVRYKVRFAIQLSETIH